MSETQQLINSLLNNSIPNTQIGNAIPMNLAYALGTLLDTIIKLKMREDEIR